MNGPAAAQVRRRAFVVAIQKYEKLTGGLAPELPGTHDNALEFRRWLIDKQGVAAGNVHLCTEREDLEGRTAGATLEEIRDELKRLKTAGKDQTEELYFYFSGHGFCYTDSNDQRLADVLVAANYRDTDSGTTACVDINSVQAWLRTCLGPLDHYYFIDCCRNFVDTRRLPAVSPLGLSFDASALGTPTVYTMYSTTEGKLAAVASGFTGLLVEGLNGDGRAKVWRNGGMAVMFDSVRDYVEAKLQGQPLDQIKRGSRPGVIREIKPPPKYRCKIVVKGARASDRFELKVVNGHDQPIDSLSFKGAEVEFTEVPDDYYLTVTTPGATVEPVDRLPVDLYQDRTVHFEKRAPEPDAQPAPPGPSENVTIVAPEVGSIQLRDLTTGHTEFATRALDVSFSPGRHLLTVLDGRDVRIDRHFVEVSPRRRTVIDLSELRHSPLRDSLLDRTPGQHGGGVVDFSESLGPTPDQGMDLWLALIGASRIMSRWAGDFSKLEALPLATFDRLPRGASPIYVLAGLDDPTEGCSAGLSTRPKRLRQVKDLPGLFELLEPDVAAGNHLLSVGVGQNAPLTLPVTTVSNHVALITVSRHGDGGDVRIQRFLLPTTPAHLEESPLGFVRRRVEMQREFAAGRDLDDLLERDELHHVMRSAHVEPIGALLAAYELARRGRHPELERAAPALRAATRVIPDSAAIGRLAGIRARVPSHPPLFLDGLFAFDLMPDRLPLPVASLDFSGPWTAWRGVALQ